MSMQSNFVFGRTNPKSGNANRRRYLHWIQPASPFWQNGGTNPIILYSAAPIAARSPCAKSLGFDHDHSRMQVLNPVASTSQSGLHRPTCEGASKRSFLGYHLFGAKTKCFQSRPKFVNCKLSWAMAGSRQVQARLDRREWLGFVGSA